MKKTPLVLALALVAACGGAEKLQAGPKATSAPVRPNVEAPPSAPVDAGARAVVPPPEEPPEGPAASIGAVAADGQPTHAISLNLVANLPGLINDGDVSPNGDAVICGFTVRVLATGAERPAFPADDELVASQRGTYLLKRGGKLVARRAFDGIEIAGGRAPKPDVDAISVSEDGRRYAVTESLPSANSEMRAKITVYDTKTGTVLNVDTWGYTSAGGMVEGALSPNGLAVIWSHTRGPTIERDLALKTVKTISDTQSRFYAFDDGLRVRTPENPGFFAPKDQRVWMERGGKRTVLFTKGEDDLAPRVQYADGSKLLLLSSFGAGFESQTMRVFDATSGKELARFSLPPDAKVIYARGKTVLVAIEKDEKTALYQLVQTP